MLLRATLIWLLIAVAETAHGIVRVRVLNRRLGDKCARQVTVVSGSCLILVIALGTFRWVGAESTRDCLLVGALWLALMLGFDLGLGRLYFGLSWRRLMADFDPRQGGFLGLGMSFLFISPLLAVTWLRSS